MTGFNQWLTSKTRAEGMIFGTVEVLLEIIMVLVDPSSKVVFYVQLASLVDLQVLFARWDYEPEKIEVHGPRSGLLVEQIGLKVWESWQKQPNHTCRLVKCWWNPFVLDGWLSTIKFQPVSKIYFYYRWFSWYVSKSTGSPTAPAVYCS